MAAHRKPSKGSKPDKLMRDALMVALQREAEDADGRKTRKLYIIADRLVEKAMQGEIAAIKEIADRVDGKATQPLAADKDAALSFILAGLKVTLGAKLDRIADGGARRKLKSHLNDSEAAALLYDWSRWARPSQRQPDGDWDGWLILAGRGWGKTRTGAETVREWGRKRELPAHRAGV